MLYNNSAKLYYLITDCIVCDIIFNLQITRYTKYLYFVSLQKKLNL